MKSNHGKTSNYRTSNFENQSNATGFVIKFKPTKGYGETGKNKGNRKR